MVEPALAGRRISFSAAQRALQPRGPCTARLGREAGRPRGAAADERRRVHRELLRRGQDRRRQRAAELAAGGRRAGVHPQGFGRHRAAVCGRTSRRWWPSCSAAATRPTCAPGCRWVAAPRLSPPTTAAWTGRPADEPEAAGADDDLLFIMYTSGTTGLPKGVMHSHRTVMWSAMNVTASGRLPLQGPLPRPRCRCSTWAR